MDNKYNRFVRNNKVYMAVIAMFIALLFYYDHFVVAVIALIIYGILIAYNIKESRQQKDQWIKFVEKFSAQMDVATTSTLLNLPFPLLIVGTNGDIVWYNQNFSYVVPEDKILGKNLREITKDVNVRHILESKKNVFNYVSLNDNYYDIFSTIVYTDRDKNREDALILLYFTEVTEKHGLLLNNEDNKYSIMLIEVDNLNDVLKTTEEDQAPLLSAEIERNINSYAQNTNAMIKKYASNKYVLTIQDKFIESEIEKKFDILDNIRELSFGNKLTVTLSIGVGRGGETPQQNASYAESAKELALGRGGDQTVVKKKDKLSFFGGKTKEVEKRTKVRARVIAHALLDLISESDRVFIMGHKKPDIDCLGSAIGLCSVINSLDKECNIILEDVNNGVKNIVEELLKEPEYDSRFISSDLCYNLIDEKSLFIIVDVHNESHVENMDIVKKAKKVVIIDHHRKAPDYIKDVLLSYIETYASSTSELVTEMLPYLIEKPNLKRIEAVALLAGICVDTKNFYFKTGVRTFEAAAFLRKLGADTIAVKKMFTEDLESYSKKADIIKTAEIFKNIAIASCPEDVDDNIIAAQVADELLNITGVQASFVFVKIKDDIFISGRSLESINVQVILESLGGGGHMTMAGAKLSNITIEEAVKRLKEAIDKYLREGEK